VVIGSHAVSPAIVALVFGASVAGLWVLLARVRDSRQSRGWAWLVWGAPTIATVLVAHQALMAVSYSSHLDPVNGCDVVVRSESFVKSSRIDMYVVDAPSFTVVLPIASASAAESFGRGSGDRFAVTWGADQATLLPDSPEYGQLVASC
jgi:hypothetical protein